MNPKRILIIDDEPQVTRGIRWNLEATKKYKVRELNVADSALATAREFKPDLIILDVMMPGKDGGQVASEIRESSDLKSIPIIFLTATIQPDEQGLHGGLPFLAKPVDLDELKACIEKHLV